MTPDTFHHLTPEPTRLDALHDQPNRRIAATARRRLRRKLGHAAENNDMAMLFQPRIALASGRIIGAEAMISWPDRRNGPPRPPRPLKLAEQIDECPRIGAWALRAACIACAETLPAPASWCVSINISARQLAEGALLGQIAEALEHSGLPGERLELELSEPMLHDVSLDALLTLSAVRDLGISLSIDEFGTGFTSLALLRRLPVTAIKLDPSLLHAVPHGHDDSAILRALIQAGHALGLEIIADGVRNEAQRGFLAGMGCEGGQGSLFGPAMSLAPFQAELRQCMTKP